MPEVWHQCQLCEVQSTHSSWQWENTESACLNSCQQSLFLREEYTKRTLCHTCGVSCAGKTAYLNGIESHGEQVKSKPFCELCPCATRRPRNLRLRREHMYPTMPRTRSRVCGECGRAFFSFFSFFSVSTWIVCIWKTNGSSASFAQRLFAIGNPLEIAWKFIQESILTTAVSVSRPFTRPTVWRRTTENTQARSPRNVKQHLFRRTALMCTWRNAWREMGWLWFRETEVAWEL